MHFKTMILQMFNNSSLDKVSCLKPEELTGVFC